MKKLQFFFVFILFFSCQKNKIKTWENAPVRYLSLEKLNEKPMDSIKSIFEGYVEYSESTDSQESKDLMRKSLNSIDKITNTEDFEVLINVWMYYDPTDFPTRNLVFPVLEKNKTESIKAIKNRIKNKKDWEDDDSAPFSELNNLIKQLEK